MSGVLRRGSGPPVDQVELRTGDYVRLGHAGPSRWWWRVQAVSEHFAACVHQQPFEPAGVLCYTVLDWRNGVRGPCDRIGQAYGDGTYDEAECARMLAEFEHVVSRPFTDDGEPIANHPVHELQVSHRNRVTLEVLEVRRG